MIYADYNGSAPLCPEVVSYLQERLTSHNYANPNASHLLGQKVMMGMENARCTIAKYIGALPKQLVLNSGSTEGISQVFFSLLHCHNVKRKKNVILISSIEHSAVLKCAQFYQEDQGYNVISIPSKECGEIDVDAFISLMNQHKDNIAMVAMMAANNETAVIQPFMEVGKVCNQAKVPFLCDTTQYIGKMDFNFNESPIDFAFISGHKIGALTGAGAIIAKNTDQLKPFIIGGGQEKNLRGGTQNYLGFETIGVAIKAIEGKKEQIKVLEKERDAFEEKILKAFPDVQIMGKKAKRLPGTTFICHPKISGKSVQSELENQKIYVTTSSACSDHTGTPSKVLKAMGIEDRVARGAVRISISLGSPQANYDQIYNALKNAYEKLL